MNARETFERYWAAGEASAIDRFKFMKLAWDYLGSEFAARHTQYERFYAGPQFVHTFYNFNTCPWDDRRRQIDELNRKIATVVLVATDEAGAAIAGVQVAMDGAPLDARTDGRPVQVDPGEHQFVFSTDKGVLATKTITLASGLTLRERTWVPAMVPWRATEDGFVTPEVLEWYGRFAEGEPGAPAGTMPIGAGLWRKRPRRFIFS